MKVEEEIVNYKEEKNARNRREYQREYYMRNKEKIAARRAEQYRAMGDADKLKKLETNRRFYKNNKERLNAEKRAIYAAGKKSMEGMATNEQ